MLMLSLTLMPAPLSFTADSFHYEFSADYFAFLHAAVIFHCLSLPSSASLFFFFFFFFFFSLRQRLRLAASHATAVRRHYFRFLMLLDAILPFRHAFAASTSGATPPFFALIFSRRFLPHFSLRHFFFAALMPLSPCLRRYFCRFRFVAFASISLPPLPLYFCC